MSCIKRQTVQATIIITSYSEKELTEVQQIELILLTEQHLNSLQHFTIKELGFVEHVGLRVHMQSPPDQPRRRSNLWIKP